MVSGFFIASFLIILKEKFVNDKICCKFAEQLISKTNKMKTSTIVISIFSVLLVLIIVFGDMKG